MFGEGLTCAVLINIAELSRADADPELAELAQTFRRIATADSFPCIFSHLPFAHDAAYFSMHRREAGVGSWVYAEVRSLLGIVREQPEAIAVMFLVEGDDKTATTLDADLQLARLIVTTLRAKERLNHGPESLAASDAKWSLMVDGVEIFVNFSSPNHVARNSRNVGPAFTIIAQPRAAFDHRGRAGSAAREEIRQRLWAYDDVQPHPCLGTYGAPGNREALQYFLGDGISAHDASEVPHG
jgi:FPC/CPF motif-containing protein YcgG